MFNGAGGNDVVLDFEAGTDMLRIAHGINGLELSTAQDAASLVTDDDGGNAVFDFGNGDTVTLNGVSAGDVQADPSKFILVV